MKKIVISLYDYTGEAVKPWAEAGYDCHCYDIQHKNTKVDAFPSGGSIHYLHADLHDPDSVISLCYSYIGKPVLFGMAFPVCTDMAVSGAAHFERKVDPEFQDKAAEYAIWCSRFFENLNVPYFIENPVSVLSTLWRKPDYMFHPYEYGGYIPEGETEHPTWPEYIAPQVMPTLRRLAYGQAAGSRCLYLNLLLFRQAIAHSTLSWVARV